LFTSLQFITNNNNNHYNMARKEVMKAPTKKNAADKAPPAKAAAAAFSDAEKGRHDPCEEFGYGGKRKGEPLL
jgi:hypothetical protein